MRQFTEPSCRHLLRQPLIFGIPFIGLLILSFSTVLFQFLAQGDTLKSLIGLGVSAFSYVSLRIMTHFSKVGWDQTLLFWFERLFSSSKGTLGKVEETPTEIEVTPPDTLDDLGPYELQTALRRGTQASTA